MQSILRILVVLGALAAAAGPATAADPVRTYRADLHESDWLSKPGERACHLIHQVPGIGAALFTTTLRDNLALTIFTQRPPEYATTATIEARPPRWGSGEPRTLGETQVYPARSALRFGHRLTARILTELEAGREVVFRFESYFDDGTVEIVLQPARFGPAYQRHLNCKPHVTTGADSTPPEDTVGDAAAGPAGQAPAMTAELAFAMIDTPPRPGSKTNRTGGSPARDRTPGAVGVGAAGIPTAESDATEQAGTAQLTARAASPSDPVPPGVPVPPAKDIHFVYDSARLDREDLDRIDDLAQQIAGNPHWSGVVLTGHADSAGSPRYNRKLGLARAQRVRARLVEQGVEPEKIRLQTDGEANPVGDNDTVYGRAENRRVDVSPRL